MTYVIPSLIAVCISILLFLIYSIHKLGKAIKKIEEDA